jgi:hypothetical protein
VPHTTLVRRSAGRAGQPATTAARQGIQRRRHMRHPARHHQITPPAGKRRLRRGRELHPVGLRDPVRRADIDQPRAVASHCQDVRDVLDRAIRGREPQPERLADHLCHRAREVQRQPGFLQALEPVMQACAHHELQARAMPLCPAPGEPAHRLAPGHRERTQITDRTDHLRARDPPSRGPPPRPAIRQVQDLARDHLTVHDEIRQAARVRMNRPGAGQPLQRQHPLQIQLFVFDHANMVMMAAPAACPTRHSTGDNSTGNSPR